MNLAEFSSKRIREVNQKPPNESGEYILYWMQAYRRLHCNHSLDYSIQLSIQTKLPLVIYEGLRKDYPWNSERIHKFILEGMEENRKLAEKYEINYFPFVETETEQGHGILKKLSEKAHTVVTDDFPCFIIPKQTQSLSKKIDHRLVSIDGNSIIPISAYGNFASAARILRPRIHKLFAAGYESKSASKPNFQSLPKKKISCPFPIYKGNFTELLGKINFQNSVSSVDGIHGGTSVAQKILKEFIQTKLARYSTDRSNPNSPEKTAVTGLSAYLHFGHISVEEIITEVLNFGTEWSLEQLKNKKFGDRASFFHQEEFVNLFLDELITWRDIGYLFFWDKKEFRKDLSSLPDWIKKNLEKHKSDKREFKYSKSDWENSRTHDELWNSAQTELVQTGRMHNYMRMLWGKKLIEWSSSYEEAFELMEEFNNKYAYDGRNPNSYTGILWCFGLFDRPWFPERNVLGVLRYMSSDSTRKKFKMNDYLSYIKKLKQTGDTLFD
ncbi:MAG: deoxyribodipyrimidine photolyase [Leptospiraceae bacterium]|nr:deoxyribodipyrimidine photolyase [Leptospiraceae bacterium]